MSIAVLTSCTGGAALSMSSRIAGNKVTGTMLMTNGIDPVFILAIASPRRAPNNSPANQSGRAISTHTKPSYAMITLPSELQGLPVSSKKESEVKRKNYTKEQIGA